jgi:hypothetical protein
MPTGMPPNPTTVITSTGQTVYLGAVSAVDIPLPAGAGPEVVFDAATQTGGFTCGPPFPASSFLLDDLRVE